MKFLSISDHIEFRRHTKPGLRQITKIPQVTTTYYLRSLGASNIEKATVAVKKETRGAVKEGTDGGQNSGDAGGSHETVAPAIASDAVAAKRTYTAEEKTACSIEAMRNGEACEACQ